MLTEKWNPKWKQVLKFLVGIKGHGIIGSILNEKDNPIHSKLFLSAELIQETEVDNEECKEISQKLEDFMNDPIFAADAHKHWVYVNGDKTINWLFEGNRDIDYEAFRQEQTAKR